jgi:uncharacterized protein Yka (UPF0111/DUF47 family)
LSLDFIEGDHQMQEYIDENEKIIEKYHRKIDEMFQLVKENSGEGMEMQWSPIALDFKRMEDEEKRLCDEKKQRLMHNQINSGQDAAEDKGVYL